MTGVQTCALPILKAYRCPDGKVRVFRMDENAKRLQSTCRGCPECNAELDKIERPPKTTFFTWLIAILAALIVGVVVYGIFEPNF